MPDTDDDGRQLTSEPGAWMPILQAAERLRITDRSIRRMAAEGRLLRRLERGKAEVWIPESMPAVTGTDESPDVNQDIHDDDVRTSIDDNAGTMTIMSQQRAMIEWVNDLAARQTAPLLDMIDARDETIQALERENGRLKAELDAEKARQVTSTDVKDARPWWVRWFAPRSE